MRRCVGECGARDSSGSRNGTRGATPRLQAGMGSPFSCILVRVASAFSLSCLIVEDDGFPRGRMRPWLIGAREIVSFFIEYTERTSRTAPVSESSGSTQFSCWSPDRAENGGVSRPSRGDFSSVAERRRGHQGRSSISPKEDGRDGPAGQTGNAQRSVAFPFSLCASSPFSSAKKEGRHRRRRRRRAKLDHDRRRR